MTLKHHFLLVLTSGILFLSFVSHVAVASPKTKAAKVSISGSISGEDIGTVLLITASGATTTAQVSHKKFAFNKIASAKAKNASLQLLDPDGRYAGPILLATQKGKGLLYLSSKLPAGTNLKLGKITVANGYGKLKKTVGTAFLNTKVKTTLSGGKPVGAGKGGLTTTSGTGISAASLIKATDTTGGDTDRDGVPSALDVDDDGDGLLDAVDPDSSSGSARENPFSTLYLSLGQTLNVNLGQTISDTQLDSVIQNNSNIIFYQSLEPGSSVTGGHVICSTSNPYCAPSTGTAVYSGVSESDNSLRGSLWTAINTDGSGYPNLEYLSSRSSLVAGIQPGVGLSSLVPGDVFQLELTDSSHAVISRKVQTLAPYFVTVPAMQSYNAGAGAVTIDYTSGSIVGSSESSPIVSTSGTFQATFFRPQRLAVSGAEAITSSRFRDQGGLHYGVILSTQTQEFGCGGSYSSLSSTLTESTDSELSLWPLTDSASDAVPASTNTLSFTVDLAACIRANGASPGTYSATLTAAGTMLSGGANRAAQMFYITIP